MLLPAGGGGGGMSIIVPGAGSGAGTGGAGGGSPPGPPAAPGGGFCGDGLMCEWVLLAAAVGLGLCTCCMLICAGAGCISAWTAPGTGGSSSATPAEATGKAPPKKIVASFLHGDTYSPGVLSARACREQERGDPYSGINSLRSSGALAHEDGHPVTGPLRTSTSLAPLHGDDSGSIKARFDPGMGR